MGCQNKGERDHHRFDPTGRSHHGGHGIHVVGVLAVDGAEQPPAQGQPQQRPDAVLNHVFSKKNGADLPVMIPQHPKGGDFPGPFDNTDERSIENGAKKDDGPEKDQRVDHLAHLVDESVLQHLLLECRFGVVGQIGP